MKKKVRWIIRRKDGSVCKFTTKEKTLPYTGDGETVEGIHVKVVGKLACLKHNDYNVLIIATEVDIEPQ